MARRRPRLLSHQIEAIEYRHADDGLPYRHDFERGDSAIELERDGSVRISNKGTALWDVFDVDGHRQPFLVNPRGRRDRMAKTKRRPPKGFKTWTAYMASIRPGAAKKKRRTHRRNPATSSRSGVVMASKKRRRRRNPAANPARGARRVVSRRRRRNPPGGLGGRNILNLAIDGVLHGGLVVGGKMAARLGRKQLGYTSGSVVGAAVEMGVGVAIGILAPRFLGGDKARSAMHGAFAGAIESVVKDATKNSAAGTIGKTVFDSLGDAGPFDTTQVFLPADSSIAIRDGNISGMGAYADQNGLGAYAPASLPVSVM